MTTYTECETPRPFITPAGEIRLTYCRLPIRHQGRHTDGTRTWGGPALRVVAGGTEQPTPTPLGVLRLLPSESR